ncbi:MAG: inosine/xanthosine triphosphatase [Bacteroidota bacterium]
MRVLIASMRAPKINGVQRAFRKLSHIALFNAIVFEPMQIESGVQATPLSIDELMTGARQRAETAFAISGSKNSENIFSVGVEGGVYISQQHAFLQSWACIYDGLQTSYGSSGSIEIPQTLSDAVVRDGADLGKVIDIFAEQNDVRSNQGTWGILTDDLITREDSFELATLNALAPFFNKKMYERKTLE